VGFALSGLRMDDPMIDILKDMIVALTAIRDGLVDIEARVRNLEK
jgi:hypothetical protein